MSVQTAILDTTRNRNADLPGMVPGFVIPVLPSPSQSRIEWESVGPECDPTTSSPDLTIAIRAFHFTEITLQRLCSAAGFTFWGQAAALVLEFAALNAHALEIDFSDIPACLSHTGGSKRYPVHLTSRGIMTPLSPFVCQWLSQTARAANVSRERAASMILHRHSRRIVNAILTDNAAPQAIHS